MMRSDPDPQDADLALSRSRSSLLHCARLSLDLTMVILLNYLGGSIRDY